MRDDGPAASRRQLLTGSVAAGAGVVAGGLGGYFAKAAPAAAPSGGGDEMVPFYGPHQAGIATPAQDRLAFGTMNVVAGTTAADLRDLLRTWTEAAARHDGGQTGRRGQPSSYAPPVDTGEAVGSPVGGLTVTLGYGPALFDHRFGLAARSPPRWLALPPLPNEELDPDFTGGDLCVQACSDDPLVAFHAVRNLARIGMGVVEHNWMELGLRPHLHDQREPGDPAQPARLQGRHPQRQGRADRPDGQLRLGRPAKPTSRGCAAAAIWSPARSACSSRTGTATTSLDQEHVIGRAKISGAPLSGGTEFTTPNFAAAGSDGQPAIPANSHIRLASHEQNDGTRILRRGYSFTDGIDPQAGTLLGGLFFIAFMKNPQQFIKLQTALAADALNEYIKHTGSAIFACPPGLRQGQHWGDTLFT